MPLAGIVQTLCTDKLVLISKLFTPRILNIFISCTN